MKLGPSPGTVLRRWFRRAPPERRPHGWLGVGWHFGAPLVANLAFAYFLLAALPEFFGISLGALSFFILTSDMRCL